jgi:hypothetical protein
MLVDPGGPITFVAGERDRPDQRHVVLVGEPLGDGVEQVFQRRRFVSLAGRQMKMQRQPFAVAEQMNLRRIPAAGPA